MGCENNSLSGPQAEVNKPNTKMSLPAVPTFDLPPPNPEYHTPKEMRVKGKKLLCQIDPTKPLAGQCDKVTIKGFITWKYDCLRDLMKPGDNADEVKKKIADNMDLCERQKFYIGDAKDTPPEKSVWIVDVPRPYTERELKGQYKDEKTRVDPTKCEPEKDAKPDAKPDPKKSKCPVYDVNDEVMITGEWRINSDHSERNSEGFLVYKTMKNLTNGWETPPPKDAPADPTKPATTNTGTGTPQKQSPKDFGKKPG